MEKKLKYKAKYQMERRNKGNKNMKVTEQQRNKKQKQILVFSRFSSRQQIHFSNNNKNKKHIFESMVKSMAYQVRQAKYKYASSQLL